MIALFGTGYWDVLAYRFLASVTHHAITPAIQSLMASYFYTSGRMGTANSLLTVSTSLGAGLASLTLIVNSKWG